MKPLQVYFAEPELARLDAWARKRGVTKSQAVRAAVRILTRAPDDDPILGMSGMIDLGPADLSERVDDYLEETHVAEGSPAYARRGRSIRRRIRR
jgi:hypothetical protein